MEPIEFMSPEVVDKEGNTIKIEISGTNDIIQSTQQGNKVKTVVNPSEVTVDKVGTYLIEIILRDDSSTFTTSETQMLVIKYIEQEEEILSENETDDQIYEET